MHLHGHSPWTISMVNVEMATVRSTRSLVSLAKNSADCSDKNCSDKKIVVIKSILINSISIRFELNFEQIKLQNAN